MKAILTGRILAAALSIVASAAVGTAQAADVHVGVNIGTPAPVYVVPTPVYAPPPLPVVYQAAPPLFIGWHDDRYWDGRRYWNRGDWERHHGHGRGHDKHGHGHGNGHGNGHGHH
jgi:hypothetical protein